MTTDTYNAIMEHIDQFISYRPILDGLFIAIMADNKETIDAITTIARDNGHTVRKNRVGDKYDLEAEMHLRIK